MKHVACSPREVPARSAVRSRSCPTQPGPLRLASHGFGLGSPPGRDGLRDSKSVDVSADVRLDVPVLALRSCSWPMAPVTRLRGVSRETRPCSAREASARSAVRSWSCHYGTWTSSSFEGRVWVGLSLRAATGSGLESFDVTTDVHVDLLVLALPSCSWPMAPADLAPVFHVKDGGCSSREVPVGSAVRSPSCPYGTRASWSLERRVRVPVPPGRDTDSGTRVLRPDHGLPRSGCWSSPTLILAVNGARDSAPRWFT